MTILKAWAAGLGLLLAALAALGGYGLIQEHDARLKAETVQSQQAQVISAAQKSIDQAKADQAQSNAALASQLAQIAAERKAAPTPQQFIVDVSKLLPNLPAPVTIQPTAAVPATSTAPAQPASQEIVIPQADIPEFQTYKLNCDESNAKLLSCTTNAQAVSEQLAASQSQYKAEEIRADSWETAAKGGTWLQRMKTAAKWLGVGAAVGAAAGYAAHR